MAISLSDVDYVAKLARLRVSEEEKSEVAEKLTAVLEYMEQLSEINTEGILPTTHVLPLLNVFREDELRQGLAPEEALANAKESEDGYFKAPKII